MKVMFDTNAFDKAINNIALISKHLDTISIYITDVQIIEIANIPDSKKAKRSQIFSCLCSIRPILIPHPFTFDRLDFGHFSFQIEPKYRDILKETGSNKNDALIAATAIHEGCTLVTNDDELTKRVLSVSEKVMTFEDFLKELE